MGASSIQGEGDGGVVSVRAVGACSFLRRYFFLLDVERVRRTVALCRQEQPQLYNSFMEAMLGQETTRCQC